MRLIDADMLCKYCDNNINHSITPNEIMRMPFIEAEPVKHGRWSEDDEGFYHCSVCKELSDWEECQAWIDASIRLPDDNGDVLVWYQCKCCGKTSQSWGITFCSRGDWYKKHLDGECINVLFWRKLPKPPTRECDAKMDGGVEDVR